MRLLHLGHDPADQGAARASSRTRPGDDRRMAEFECLSVHGICPDHRGRGDRRSAIPGACTMNAPLGIVGANLPRKDALDKVSGRAEYAVDLALPGMLHAKVLRSSRAHALIKRLDVD